MTQKKKPGCRPATIQSLKKLVPSLCKLAGATPTDALRMNRGKTNFTAHTAASPDSSAFAEAYAKDMRFSRLDVRGHDEKPDFVIAGKTGFVAKNALSNVVYKDTIEKMSKRAVVCAIEKAMKTSPSLAENAEHVFKQVGTYLGFDLDLMATTDCSRKAYKNLFAFIAKPADKARAQRIARYNVVLAKHALDQLKADPTTTLKPV